MEDSSGLFPNPQNTAPSVITGICAAIYKSDRRASALGDFGFRSRFAVRVIRLLAGDAQRLDVIFFLGIRCCTSFDCRKTMHRTF